MLVLSLRIFKLIGVGILVKILIYIGVENYLMLNFRVTFSSGHAEQFILTDSMKEILLNLPDKDKTALKFSLNGKNVPIENLTGVSPTIGDSLVDRVVKYLGDLHFEKKEDPVFDPLYSGVSDYLVVYVRVNYLGKPKESQNNARWANTSVISFAPARPLGVTFDTLFIKQKSESVFNFYTWRNRFVRVEGPIGVDANKKVAWLHLPYAIISDSGDYYLQSEGKLNSIFSSR
jgi:hypothetical protein